MEACRSPCRAGAGHPCGICGGRPGGSRPGVQSAGAAGRGAAGGSSPGAAASRGPACGRLSAGLGPCLGPLGISRGETSRGETSRGETSRGGACRGVAGKSGEPQPQPLRCGASFP
mmetsp:Transcript_29687/g.66577  ORF Transcript_29687/g.66577 Transcript_29687/m.66577 type:complete len:116 (-) Transcript_29687:769-1116(-)